MSSNTTDILTYHNGTDEAVSVKSKTVKSLRKELGIDANARVSVNGQRSADSKRISSGDVVAWFDEDKSGAA